MTAREWKPGDVVKILTGCFEGRIGYLTATTGESRNLPVALSDGEEESGIGVLAYGPSSVRPLVVIDPEDREQVERLWLTVPNYTGTTVDQLQNALRRFADPKPEEPQGLGAVVEDDQGNLWVRAERVALAYMHWHSADSPTRCAKWAGINAVRVLSEGVTA